MKWGGRDVGKELSGGGGGDVRKVTSPSSAPKICEEGL